VGVGGDALLLRGRLHLLDPHRRYLSRRRRLCALCFLSSCSPAATNLGAGTGGERRCHWSLVEDALPPRVGAEGWLGRPAGLL
jgi:hypothetical protein